MALTGATLPVAWGTPVGLASGLVLPANPSRTALVFRNVSTAAAIAIIPNTANIALTQGAYVGSTIGVAAVNGAGSITMQPGDIFVIDTLQCTTAWNGIASGTGGNLTILES
jgi:hypothetical protein